MKSLERILKYFSKKNIEVVYDNKVYYIKHLDQVQGATLLLPDHLSLEEKAITQLLNFANVQYPNSQEHVCKACATPDFHAGSTVPVGSIVSTTPNMVIPSAIGTDINCGMRMVKTGISWSDFKEKEQEVFAELTQSLLHGQRNIPMSQKSMLALFNGEMLEMLHELSVNPKLKTGLWENVNFSQLVQDLQNVVCLNDFKANSKYAPESMLDKEIFRDPGLGTIGSGNHFVEFQIVNQNLNKKAAYDLQLKEQEMVFMVHSGSRNLGFYIGQRWMEQAKAQYPTNLKKPVSDLYALVGDLSQEYLQAMGVAAFYALLNRIVLAEMVNQTLNKVFKIDKTNLIVDVPHNVVLQEDGFNIHRKGATPAHEDQLALIPGSMGDYSYLVKGLGNDQWLKSCSHGAGRQMRRQEMWQQKDNDKTHDFKCITLKQERIIEEHPSAYKPIGEIINAQEQEGLIQSLVQLKPYATFKA